MQNAGMRNGTLASCVDEPETWSAAAEDVLVREMLAGSERAWRAFHARYDRLIYRCITRVTGRFSTLVGQDDIREIYATLFMQLLSGDMHKLRTFDPARGNRLGSWIGLLAINCAYDYLRSMRREPLRAPLVEAEGLSSALPSPLEHAVHRERAELVGAVLRELSERDREFVSLYFAEGLPADEVAQRMQISLKTVYSKKHKIQSRLQGMLSVAQLAA
jgi:RNA polymerase sigma-70 factor (ECF subfamily)